MDRRPHVTCRQRTGSLTLVLLAGNLVACNATSPPGSGGVDVEPGPCGRGLAVVATGYESVNVALLDTSGNVLSSSFISSADRSPSLSAALGGDTVLPTTAASGTELLLIDRYPNSVLTWVELETARVTRQLSVATGFLANPHDYVAVRPNKAYVTRYEPNFDGGREPFDRGSDVLIIDPEAALITGSIQLDGAMLGEDPRYTPHPGRALLMGNRLMVLLAGYSVDYTDSAESRLVAIDTGSDQIVETLVLDGLHGCTSLAKSPEANKLAVSCSGKFRGSSAPDAQYAGLLVIDAAAGLREERRFEAAALGETALSDGLDWIDADRLMLTTFGNFADDDVAARDDGLHLLDLRSGSAELLLRSQGTPFSFGDVRCHASCGDCWLADASRNVIHHFVRVDGDPPEHRDALQLNDGIGLPPRYLGWF